MKTFTTLISVILCMHILLSTAWAQEGREHTLVVCEGGTVKSFGYNTSCQLGSGSQSPTSITTPYSISSSYMDNAVSVAVGDKHSLALMDDGTVKAWGSNVAGCSGSTYPSNLVVCTPNEIDLPGCAVAVAAGGSFSMALLADGTIYAWGRNNYGQLGNGTNTTDTHLPNSVAGITTAIAIAAGGQHAMALLEDGTVMVWGYGGVGQLGDGTTSSTNHTAGSITVPLGMSDVVAIDAGGNHCIVLTDDNKVYTWGANSDGQLGIGSTTNEDEPQFSSNFSAGTEIDVAAGSDFSIVLRSGGSTRVAGSNQRRQLGLPSPTSSPWPSTPITGPTITNAVDVVAPPTARHAWAITTSGAVYTWGDNNYGACGFVSAYPEVDTPTAVSGLGCTALPSEANHPQPCCVSVLEDERIELIGDQTFTSGFNYSGQNISVQGTITLSGGQTYWLTNCDVICWKDAKIVVEDDSYLIIRSNSHLYACGDMWDGIEAENGTYVYIYSGSLIEDAEVALEAEDGCYYYVTDATFNKNYNHIKITDPSTTPVHAVQTIRRSKFLCQTTASIGSTPVHTNLLPPRETEYTWIQIQALDVRGLKVGASGYGNTLDHAVVGVAASGVKDVDVLYNNFTDVGWFGTSASYGPGLGGETIDISHNSYTRSQIAISCHDNDITVRAHITDNDIDFSGMGSPPPTGMRGISVSEVTPGGGNHSTDYNYFDISDNDITEATTGIHLENLRGNNTAPTATLIVSDNTITHKRESTDDGSGVKLQNVVESAIVENDITHPSGHINWWETAIRISGSNGNAVYCNNLHDIGNGILFDGYQTVDTRVATNIFDRNHRGLMLNWGDIGPQPINSSYDPHDNQWIDPNYWDINNYKYTTQVLGTHTHTTSLGVRVGPASVYYPDENDFQTGGSPISVTVIGGTWQNTCRVFTGPSFKSISPQNLDASAKQYRSVLERSEAFDDRGQSQKWMDEYALYDRVSGETDMVNGDLKSFITAHRSGNMGKLQDAISGFRTAQIDQLEASKQRQALKSVQPSNRVESTLKEVLELLYANTNELANVSEETRAQLEDIALRCPLDDGFGVYMARASLVRQNELPRQFMNDCEKTPESPFRWSSSTVQSESEFSVYPNPSNGNIKLIYTMGEKDNAQIEVHDLLGHLAFSQPLSSTGSESVDLTDVSNGLYVVRITINGELKYSEKLNLIR